jgi:sugar-specific transcriptional regulator TrmB
MSVRECVDALREVGFSALEAEVYTHLLRHSPATGYAIAKGLGRHKPNVYEALTTLEAKGAVLVDDGEIRLYRAAPSEELMRQIDRRFQKSREHAITMAKTLEGEKPDHRIYHLSTWDQVQERGFAMLSSCQDVAFLELDPWPLEAFREIVEMTAARGVRTTARIYEDARLPGVMTIVSPFTSEFERCSAVQMMTLIVDGTQFLMALVTPEDRTVHQAVWSESPFLSYQCFSFMNTDLLYYSLRPLLESVGSLEELRREVKRLEERFPVGEDTGYRGLQELYGW